MNATNAYCKALGIETPRLEVAARNKERVLLRSLDFELGERRLAELGRRKRRGNSIGKAGR
jgi:hypothetical protein